MSGHLPHMMATEDEGEADEDGCQWAAAAPTLEDTTDTESNATAIRRNRHRGRGRGGKDNNVTAFTFLDDTPWITTTTTTTIPTTTTTIAYDIHDIPW